MIKYSYIRRYRLSENHIKILDYVAKMHKIESDFVRSAIIEKFCRDYPDHPLNKTPF